MSGGWLTGPEIIEQVKKKNIVIEPFEQAMVNPNSYNYHLGNTLLRLKDEILDIKKEDDFEAIKLTGAGYTLLPGECYLGTTVERFGSNKFASLITGRSSVGRKFLTNHVTAGLIDQGFFGQITLEITVIKPTRVYPGIIFGQIFWFTVSGLPCLYSGKYQNQDKPTLSQMYRENMEAYTHDNEEE